MAEAGKPLVIVYDRYESKTYVPPARCYDEIGGYYYDCPDSYGHDEYNPYQARELQYRIDGGPVVAVAVPTGNPGVELAIPATATGELEYWFKLTRTSGEIEWDSRFGHNYHINVLPPAAGTVVFDEGFHQTLTGAVRAAGSVKLDYDRDRLVPTLRKFVDYDNIDVRIFAEVSFDGAPALELPVDIGFAVTQAPLVEVPARAKRMSVWFKGQIHVFGSGGYEWRDVWDSNYGANYVFTVSP